MKDVTEDGRYFGPYDHTVHSAEGHHFYIEDNLWDTYRSRHPLQLLIEPERQDDTIRSYVLMYAESGWMPHFPYMRGDLVYMIGNHAASMIADSYFKGHHDFDVEKAYEGLRKNAFEATMLPDRRGPISELERFYFQNGFFPALQPGEKESVAAVNPEMRRQAVSVTLETAYDDWNIARLAQALGKKEDAALFSKRALNYRNVFNPATGFMAPRTSDGQFIPNINPKWAGGQAGRDYYTECNGLVYTFHVQHDVAGLIDLIGGRQKFIARLDSLFSDGYDGQLKFVFLSQFPDSTGLMGQYPRGMSPPSTSLISTTTPALPGKRKSAFAISCARGTPPNPSAFPATMTTAPPPPGTSSAPWASTPFLPAVPSTTSAVPSSAKFRSISGQGSASSFKPPMSPR